jgi:hypothetical protein
VTTDPDFVADHAPIFCARCAAELLPGTGNFYRLNIEAVADPSPPIFSAEEIAGNLREDIEHLVTQMADLSEQEALDQIYRRLTFHLCAPCFRRWIENPAGSEAEGSMDG